MLCLNSLDFGNIFYVKQMLVIFSPMHHLSSQFFMVKSNELPSLLNDLHHILCLKFVYFTVLLR